jgi:arylsulfatase A-like enzyme
MVLAAGRFAGRLGGRVNGGAILNRHMCGIILAGLIVNAASMAQSAPATTAPASRAARVRPNVVFLLADQWRAQALGFAGDPNARTPNLDRLASQSVMLTTSVSTCPVCTPYRASLITGRYPTTTGMFLNDIPLNREAVSLAQAFAAGGYRTAYIGKWHIDGHGRSEYIPPERRQGFDFWRVCECTHDYTHSLYYADTAERLYWKGYDAEAQTAEAQAYIRAHRSEPFLLVLSWGPPHNPYETAPARFRKLFKPADMRLRPNVPPEAQAAARRDLAGYYAHGAALDDCVSSVVGTLKECCIEGNTILVFTSDHGDMLGSHGQERKQRPWDESILTPFLVRWPDGLGRAARKLAAPLGSPDIMPTLLGLCGLPIPKTVEGDDRSAWLLGREGDGEHDALICCVSPFGEWTRKQGGREFRGLRTRRYTYLRSLDGPWMLYDNQEDPYQQHDVIGDPKYATIQADLERRLQAALKKAHDEFLPGQQYVAKWGYKTDANGNVPKRP